MQTKAEFAERNYFTRKPRLDDAGLSERLYELGRRVSQSEDRKPPAGSGMDANDGKVRMP
jgi:hypothetical protein